MENYKIKNLREQSLTNMKNQSLTQPFDQSGSFYYLFYKASEFITSLALVIIFLIVFMAYRFYEVQTLFLEKLPNNLNGHSRDIAANLFALVLIFTTLLFMVNSSRSLKWGKFILALIALIINVYFWKAMEGKPEDIFFKFFISAVIAGMDYGFAHLFDTMWRERLEMYDKDRLLSTKKDLEIEIKELEGNENVLHENISKLLEERIHLEADLSDRIQKLNESSCPHCGEFFSSPKALNGHLGWCKEKK